MTLSKKSFTRQLYPSYMLIIILSLVAVGGYASNSFRNFYLKQAAKDLTIRAQLLKERLDVLSETTEINRLVNKIGADTNTRYTIINREGLVLGDSKENPIDMENHSDRFEIIKALQGEHGISIRFSQTLKKKMMYVAIPINSHSIKGVVRAAIPLTDVSLLLENLFYKLLFVGFIIAILAAGLGWKISQKLVMPLREMRDTSERFASGELDIRLSIPANEEMAALAESMNLMAKQLNERIKTIANQKNEIEAILTSMTESLLAVNSDEKIIKINQAAMKLLNIEDKEVFGKSIQEVIRNTELQDLVKKSLKSTQPIEKEIVLQGLNEQYCQVNGTALIAAQGESMGALLVLNDVTKIRRLEGIRRDFVANVSHELKTPITSIKGFVETLLDGALDDRNNAIKFLNIMAKQSDRLNAIIEDLLSLSRIEQEAEKEQISLKHELLLPVIQAAIELCDSKCLAKGIEIKFNCPAPLKANINASMLEQALVNLIDNAIKYSPEHSVIVIDVTHNKTSINISVTDKGDGISAEHLDRLFERFYRVDKARSRKVGGTGLGLAIVKHISQSHGGSVSVSSEVEKGSSFTLHLPL